MASAPPHPNRYIPEPLVKAMKFCGEISRQLESEPVNKESFNILLFINIS
jgi:hypothetical protein